MSHKLKVQVIVAALFAGVVALFLLGPATRASSVVFEDVTASSPRALYVQNCARCHGADGKSETALGRKYKADDISGGVGVNKTTRIVTNGKGRMPSFKKRLSAAQIAQIANYVNSL
ncbi:MAG TPA: cytochrome c [Pyrinomonadaceae bacterium]